ncbi:energy transducer TonB [uncultured Tenacibaculum sp.]|uniref:energy transducer TonB n=2 Tax=Tenacibaculum TaxID=104267 RepID=UPI002624AF9F|nr:energy transducer TonB [uncultured Tenacibaculum sp.]
MKTMKNGILFLITLFLIGACSSNKKTFTKRSSTKNIVFKTIEKAPVFPGCEAISLEKERRVCFNKMMQKHVVKNFNLNIASCLEKKKVYNQVTKIYDSICINILKPGKKRIYLQFKIGKKGSIEDINARAPHPKLRDEAIRIAKLLPQLIPGYQEGKPVRVGYTIPITFNVE